jgi:uncharacterized protein YdhG (YjbR/CyaY superfamily)
VLAKQPRQLAKREDRRPGLAKQPRQLAKREDRRPGLAKQPRQRPRQPATIDEYLAQIDPAKRTALERLRKDILAVIPTAEECISYQLPGFRLDGRVLVWFGATARHCSFYPGGVVEQFRDALAAYDTSKGTIRFDPERPLPASLVRKLVKARSAAVFRR